MATLARLRFAIRCRMSISRVTSADLVTMPTGWPALIEHFENAAHDFVFALDRLIGIGVGADRDHARLVAEAPPVPSPAVPARPAWPAAWISKSSPGDSPRKAWVGRAKQ